ncbi:hypothetical protein AALA13_01755 [Lachnospiraceae bacterium 50-23]|jgi:hypothetical protein|nr:hypothetical protein [Dorea sp.]GFI36005.1 hypothetical protein IMSAGC015_00164 [Lachnospiraceae bacterium]
MKNREELLTEVVRQLQKNYVRFVEIERITKELGDALSGDDRGSVQLLFGMRQEEMDRASEGRERIITILETLEEADQAELRAILNETDVQKAEDFESRKIIELNGQIKSVLNRTISIDKVISRKLAGEHSYYQ